MTGDGLKRPGNNGEELAGGASELEPRAEEVREPGGTSAPAAFGTQPSSLAPVRASSWKCGSRLRALFAMKGEQKAEEKRKEEV